MLLIKNAKIHLILSTSICITATFALKYVPLYILTNNLSKRTVSMSKTSSDLESLMSNIYEKNWHFIIKLGENK